MASDVPTPLASSAHDTQRRAQFRPRSPGSKSGSGWMSLTFAMLTNIDKAITFNYRIQLGSCLPLVGSNRDGLRCTFLKKCVCTAIAILRYT